MKINPIVVAVVASGLAFLCAVILTAYDSGHYSGQREGREQADKIIEECTQKDDLTFPKMVAICYYEKRLEFLIGKKLLKD